MSPRAAREQGVAREQDVDVSLVGGLEDERHGPGGVAGGVDGVEGDPAELDHLAVLHRLVGPAPGDLDVRRVEPPGDVESGFHLVEGTEMVLVAVGGEDRAHRQPITRSDDAGRLGGGVDDHRPFRLRTRDHVAVVVVGPDAQLLDLDHGCASSPVGPHGTDGKELAHEPVSGRLRRMRRVLLTFVLLVLAALPAAAQEDLPPGGTFYDDQGSVHEPDIEALAASGITRGCHDTKPIFCPDQPITRGQMAAFLVRAVGSPAAEGDTSRHRRLDLPGRDRSAGRSGSHQGLQPARQRPVLPGADDHRGEMATFLVRASSWRRPRSRRGSGTWGHRPRRGHRSPPPPGSPRCNPRQHATARTAR